MCYSLEVSRNSFLINTITCYILYNYNSKNVDHKILSIFFSWVGLMQLFDYIFWLNQERNRTNFIFTKIAMIVNHLQPIVLAIAIYYFNSKLKINSKSLLIIYSFIAIFYSISIYNEIDYTLTEKTVDKKHTTLYWQWNRKNNSTIVYFTFICLLSLLSYENLSYPINIIMVFINIFTYVLASDKTRSIGRMWCNTSSFVPLFLCFYYWI